MKITSEIHNHPNEFGMEGCDYTIVYRLLSAKGLVRTSQHVERLNQNFERMKLENEKMNQNAVKQDTEINELKL